MGTLGLEIDSWEELILNLKYDNPKTGIDSSKTCQMI